MINWRKIPLSRWLTLTTLFLFIYSKANKLSSSDSNQDKKTYILILDIKEPKGNIFKKACSAIKFLCSSPCILNWRSWYNGFLFLPSATRHHSSLSLRSQNSCQIICGPLNWNASQLVDSGSCFWYNLHVGLVLSERCVCLCQSNRI